MIDENGAWMTEIPMNLDYVYTNEFGEQIISSDSTVGVPTKAKYRFKIKWNQSPSLSEETRRGYFLVPNVKEWGWTGPSDNYFEDGKMKHQKARYSILCRPFNGKLYIIKQHSSVAN